MWADGARVHIRLEEHKLCLLVVIGVRAEGGLREVLPDTREQRCWFHKTGIVLGALPRLAHPAAKRAAPPVETAT